MSSSLSIDSIPHRPPFRFVDEIVEVGEGRIVTRYTAGAGAAFFQGHYPDHPVMPGVLICESAFQAGALLVAHRMGGPAAGDRVPVITRIGDARFKRIVRPGDTLEVEVTLDEELDGAYFMTGRVRAAGALALRVTFAAMSVAPVSNG
jgi:3-hydroxyacyl-[acyl-carrier-protein] dehydratase